MTGSVVSFLTADHSTCNGIIPHPTLPIFITYGIDSTAKLWRATGPVDPQVDDSPEGRRRCYRDVEYEMSPVTRKWGEVQQVLRILDSEDFKHTDIMPDQIPNTRDIARSGRFGHSLMMGSAVSQIGNDLQNLPDNLRQNLYACLRSYVDGDDAPIESDIEDLKHRISLIRLRHQADRLGLVWDPTVPWAFESRKHTLGEEAKTESGASNDAQVHPADLVPDNPSDWLPYDPDMCKSPWNFKDYFNTEDYQDFYSENYLNSDSMGSANGARDTPRIADEDAIDDDAEEKEPLNSKSNIMSNDKKEDGSGEEGRISNEMVSSSEEEDSKMKYICSVYNLLYETILLLKDGGNAALRAGDFQVAARRYDKAIQYGAVASMSFPVRDLDFAKGRREALKETGGYHLEWGLLLKTIVVTRLNMALLMLKPQFSHPEQAVEQARLALQELKPFSAAKGKIMKGSKLDSVHRANEPTETFEEAMNLQTKAYFRLGSAYYEKGEYSEAVQSFEKSIKCSKEANSAPDNLVLRRLSEAKRENKRKNKRQRKKFKFAFGVQESHRKKSDASDDA
jgi:tetratricopeptide (TPR) repeat protein